MEYLELVNSRLRQRMRACDISVLKICSECKGMISYPTLQQFFKDEQKNLDRLSQIHALCQALQLDILEILNPVPDSPGQGKNDSLLQSEKNHPIREADMSGTELLPEDCVSDRWNCEDVKEYINLHYAEKLSLESIADQFYINKFHLAKTFKKKCGLTVFQYIRKIRMEHAVRLLQNTDLAIGKVAKLCGYDDVSYFYRLFKETTGITANACRKGSSLNK